jgi:hypothetical protein
MLPLLLNNLTPLMRDALIKFLKDLEVKAKETKSPIDDLFVKFLLAILDIK